MHAAQDFVPGIRIAADTVPPGPNSRKNLAMFQKYVAHTNYAGLFGITLARGQGAYVEDVDGNVFLDCLAGASANILGYGCKNVADSYHQVALAMQHSCVPYSLNEHVAPLAKLLTEHFPQHNGARHQCIFGLSGSDGVGAALRAMRKYTGRFGVLYFNNAYHGSTALSQQASGFSTLKAGLYPPSVNFVSLDFPYWDPLDATGSKHRMIYMEIGRASCRERV